MATDALERCLQKLTDEEAYERLRQAQGEHVSLRPRPEKLQGDIVGLVFTDKTVYRARHAGDKWTPRGSGTLRGPFQMRRADGELTLAGSGAKYRYSYWRAASESQAPRALGRRKGPATETVTLYQIRFELPAATVQGEAIEQLADDAAANPRPKKQKTQAKQRVHWAVPEEAQPPTYRNQLGPFDTEARRPDLRDGQIGEFKRPTGVKESPGTMGNGCRS